MAARNENKSLSHSGFEKLGGYASSSKFVAKLPKVPSGPAPGAKPKPASKRDG